MDIEILKPLVTDEQYKTLNESLKDKEGKLGDLSSGKYVSSAKYTALEKQLNSAQELLDNKSQEYDQLKAAAGDNEKLTEEIKTLKSTYETEKANLENTYKAQLKRSTIENRIIADYRPKDVNDIIPHLDLDKISVDGDNIVGLAEQMEPLKESKAYYFGKEENKPAGGLDHGGNSGDNYSAIFAAAGVKQEE